MARPGRCVGWTQSVVDPSVVASARAGLVSLALLTVGVRAPAETTAAAVQERIAKDVAAGRPITVHVVVALCDNEHQGIVPVPAHLGDGQNPSSNLYWGALYGVRTHLSRAAGWKRVPSGAPADARVLERIVLKKEKGWAA